MTLNFGAEHLWLLPGLVALVVAAVMVVVGRRELAALIGVVPAPLSRALTVCIPARNEAARIKPTLQALLADKHAGLRVFVLDDESEDETASVVTAMSAIDPRLTLVKAEGALEGELEGFGKPRALAAALAAAPDPSSPTLFLDADVVLSEGALGGLLEAYERSGATAMSGVPRLVCEGLLEPALVPAFVSVLGARFRVTRVHDDQSEVAMLNGQLILVDPAALDEVGGWASVSGAVLEDVALAARLKSKGHALRLADLREIASTRMYTSLSGIARGFGKNVVPAVGGPLRTALYGVLAFVIACAPLATAIATSRASSWAIGAGGALIWFGVMRAQMAARRDLAVSGWPVVFAPLTYLVVMLVLLQASLAVLFGGRVRWKGRDYRASRE